MLAGEEALLDEADLQVSSFHAHNDPRKLLASIIQREPKDVPAVSCVSHHKPLKIVAFSVLSRSCPNTSS